MHHLILILFSSECLEELNTWDLRKTERHSNPMCETGFTNIFNLKKGKGKEERKEEEKGNNNHY